MSSAVEYAYPLRQEPLTLEESLAELSGTSGDALADFDQRIEAVGELSRLLLQGGSQLRSKLPAEGLAFLATFLARDHLNGLIGRELRDLDSLRRFVRIEPRKSIRTLPKGLVCHWVAGNVPLLALFSWCLSAILGNRNLIRLSVRQADVVSPLLDALKSVSRAGELMAGETHVVWFDRSNLSAHSAMSGAADVRIAWGGREAVDAIRDLPTRWHCEDVVFGPRASLAVVDPAELDEGGIRRLATDVVMFDQLACSSPQQIFVRGKRESDAFGDFIERFSTAFESQSRAYPRHPLDFSETYTINLDRTRTLLGGGRLRRDEGTRWTVAVVDTPSGHVSCANRFVQVIPFVELDEIYPHIPANVQTAVTQLDASSAEEFTERAAWLGVCRFPRPGEGNHFENPWDGVGLVSRLTRTIVRTDSPA